MPQGIVLVSLMVMRWAKPVTTADMVVVEVEVEFVVFVDMADDLMALLP
jgi:hypothetical protein